MAVWQRATGVHTRLSPLSARPCCVLVQMGAGQQSRLKEACMLLIWPAKGPARATAKQQSQQKQQQQEQETVQSEQRLQQHLQGQQSRSRSSNRTVKQEQSRKDAAKQNQPHQQRQQGLAGAANGRRRSQLDDERSGAPEDPQDMQAACARLPYSRETYMLLLLVVCIVYVCAVCYHVF